MIEVMLDEQEYDVIESYFTEIPHLLVGNRFFFIESVEMESYNG